MRSHAPKVVSWIFVGVLTTTAHAVESWSEPKLLEHGIRRRHH
jgi:hypothetical protein